MRFEWKDKDVTQKIQALAGKGLDAAAKHAVFRIKDVLGVPAPRWIVTAGPRSKDPPPGTRYYVARTPATPKAPPRKLSGRLRASVTSELSPGRTYARIGTNVIYGRRLEFGFPKGRKPHPWLMTTLVKIRKELEVILGHELALP